MSIDKRFPVFILDVQSELEDFMAMLGDLRPDDHGFRVDYVMTIVLNFLYVNGNVKEAAEAMLIEVYSVYSQHLTDPDAVKRLERIVLALLTTTYRQLEDYRMYSQIDGMLMYRLGGWAGEYAPMLIASQIPHKWTANNGLPPKNTIPHFPTDPQMERYYWDPAAYLNPTNRRRIPD